MSSTSSFWFYFWEVPQAFKDYLVNNFERVAGPSQPTMFQIISSEVTIEGGTLFDGSEDVLVAFVSTVTMNNVDFQSMYTSGSSIVITSSTVNFQNITMLRWNTYTDKNSIIYVDMNSDIIIDNIKAERSYFMLLYLRSSTSVIRNLNITDSGSNYEQIKIEKAIDTVIENWYSTI